MVRSFVFLTASALGIVVAFGQSPNPPQQTVTTEHSVLVHGSQIAYRATAGFLPIVDANNVPHAQMFYVAYRATGSHGKRPLLFVWNGGPGSNSSLLHLAAVGPRRARDSDDPRGADLVDNQDTWLRFADLVFVDPVSTGYSYPAAPNFLNDFLNDTGDADAMAEFIRIFRTHYQTRDAPVYLLGESYGTFRAAGVADVLERKHISVSGVFLISNTFSPVENHDDLHEALRLPSYTAAAYAQHKLSPALQENLDKTSLRAEEWAIHNYLPALIMGDRLSAGERHIIATHLQEFTGIAASVWFQNNLKLSVDDFAHNVLEPSGARFVGHYDTRVIGEGQDYDVAEDPSLKNGIEAAIVPYLRDELDFHSDAVYAGPFGGGWPSPVTPRGDWTSMIWDRGDGRVLDRASELADAMARNPDLRVFVASGYFDLVTPFAATEYAFTRPALFPEPSKRIQSVRYEGGHAIYMSPTVRHRLTHDAEEFLHREVSSKP